jgi:hypothetical protein
MKRYCTLLLFLSSVAGAAPALLAVHPLVVGDGEAAEAQELVAYFEALLAKVPAAKADAGKVRRFLEGQPGKHCTADGAECFSGLAQAAGANRILFVGVRLYPVVVSGRLVGADGRALAEVPLRRVDKPKGKLVEAAKRAIDELVHSLPLDDSSDVVPLVKDTTRTSDDAAKPPAPPIPDDADGAAGTWRTVGFGVAAAGGAALVGAVAFEFIAADTAHRFDAAAAATGHGPDLPLLRELQGQAVAQQTTAGVLLGVGAAALAVGGYLYLAHPAPARPEAASVALVPLPGGVALVGQFP